MYSMWRRQECGWGRGGVRVGKGRSVGGEGVGRVASLLYLSVVVSINFLWLPLYTMHL